MKNLFIFLCLLLCFCYTTTARAGEETAAPETSKIEEVELPLAIQEYLNKEMEKLPPVEQHFRKAQQLHATGKLDEAIKELNLALKEDPKDVPSNCELGIVYMGQEKYDEAIKQLEKTLKLDPQYPKTYYALANAYARKPSPDVKAAGNYLDEAVKLGYHPVPWFLDYMKKLEGETGIPEEKTEAAVSETETTAEVPVANE